MGISAALMYFPVMPALVLAALLAGLALVALPLAWLVRWLLPRAWRCVLPPRTLFLACMLAVPVLVLSGLLGHAAMRPDRDVTAEKPSREEIRARQALFRHMLPSRDAGRAPTPAIQE